MAALHAGKDWLLNFDVGVFWLVMRVLACGGVGVVVWEGVTGQLAKRKNIEVITPCWRRCSDYIHAHFHY